MLVLGCVVGCDEFKAERFVAAEKEPTFKAPERDVEEELATERSILYFKEVAEEALVKAKKFLDVAKKLRNMDGPLPKLLAVEVAMCEHASQDY